MQREWNRSQPPLRPEDSHSTKEIEHRFTLMEDFAKESIADRVELRKIADHHANKLTTHEKAILGILIVLGVLLQEKYPKLAAILLKGQI
jgi:hypothetical protein